MATKKRRKKKTSRKGKMPAGLKAYWAKKRRGKAKRKNPRKRRRAVRKAVRRRKPVSLRVKNFRRAARKPKAKRRRTRTSNPRRGVKIIRTNLRKGTKAFAQFVREQRAKFGTARVL